MLLLLTLLLVWPGPASPALAQPALSSAVRDTTEDDEPDRVRVRVKVLPGELWSATAGFGIGVGLEVQNLLLPGSTMLLTAAPTWHRGTYTASYFTADPYTARLYGLLSFFYRATGRQWYYGLGPGSAPSDQIAVEMAWVEAEARVGLHVANRKVLIQPNLRLLHHVGRGFTERNEQALEGLTPASRQHLLFVTGAGDTPTGLSYGLEAALDLRDDPFRPHRGLLVQGTARRFDGRYVAGTPAGGDLALRFDAYIASAYVFFPLSRRGHVLSLRAIAAHTDNRGPSQIPFYLLPVLDGPLIPGYGRYRFFGEDLLLFSAEYRIPLLRLLNLVGLDGNVAVHAGSIYDNLFEQFEPRLTLAKSLPPDREAYPLRPAVGLGARLYSAVNNRTILSVMAGLSREGLQIVTFRFTHDLRQIRPYAR